MYKGHEVAMFEIENWPTLVQRGGEEDELIS